VTAAVSLLTRPRPDGELTGLVYSLTEKPRDAGLEWYKRPAVLGVIVLAATAMLNLVFF
jgi:SSS family solute:Na+ symporter